MYLEVQAEGEEWQQSNTQTYSSSRDQTLVITHWKALALVSPLELENT